MRIAAHETLEVRDLFMDASIFESELAELSCFDEPLMLLLVEIEARTGVADVVVELAEPEDFRKEPPVTEVGNGLPEAHELRARANEDSPGPRGYGCRWGVEVVGRGGVDLSDVGLV